MNRNDIISAAISCMKRLIGMDYSKTYRYRWHKGGSTDCSGYVYAAYLAAGLPLVGSKVASMTSCYEVYADGFDLVYPDSYENIGKRFAKVEDISLERGDIVFYSFGTTARKNKITHVAVCYDAGHIIHTANNRNKACIQDISYGDGRIAAVIRLNENAKETERPVMQKGAAERTPTRRMQALLNFAGAELNCDGIWGTKTDAALKAYQTKMGLAAAGICDEDTWAALTGQIYALDGDFSAPPQYDIQGGGENMVFMRNLKRGMRGEDVKGLQKLLNAQDYNSGNADGIFGRRTLAAVKSAQRANQLKADGVAGRNTIAALGGTWGNKPKDELTVCTFNVKRGTYKNGTYKIIGSIVKDADIVGLQEVTPYGLKKIAGHAGKTAHMCETISGYGHGVLTNYGVDEEDITTLGGSGERRKVHHQQIGDVSFYNTHFHYTESANNTQLEQLANILGRDNSRYVIVTGDFNRQEFSELTRLGFRQANTGQVIRNTEGGASIVNKIDQVFVRGALIADVWKYETVKRKFSDHDALFVRIKL